MSGAVGRLPSAVGAAVVGRACPNCHLSVHLTAGAGVCFLPAAGPSDCRVTHRPSSIFLVIQVVLGNTMLSRWNVCGLNKICSVEKEGNMFKPS